MLIDSHCHLDYPGLAERQPEILANARAAGVTGMLNISTREAEWSTVIATAEREPDVWAAVGIHPHEADTHAGVGLERLVASTDHPKVIGIGESGLDFFYDRSDRERQAASFRTHIAAARATGLPLIVHTRDAEEVTTAIVEEEMAIGRFPLLIHCFTGTAGFARAMMAAGAFISISGIVTFKNARELQAVAAALPGERLLVETDAPFLAPVPHRGKPGEPAFVADTARFLARLRGEKADDLQHRTAVNFATLFQKSGLCA